MKIYKTRAFAKWAQKEGLRDRNLIVAVDEMNRGLVDAHLSGELKKKRISLGAKGKRGGVRTILAFKVDDVAIFLFGFKKSNQANLTEPEEKAFLILAKALLALSHKGREEKVLNGSLVKV